MLQRPGQASVRSGVQRRHAAPHWLPGAFCTGAAAALRPGCTCVMLAPARAASPCAHLSPRDGRQGWDVCYNQGGVTQRFCVDQPRPASMPRDGAQTRRVQVE